MAHEALSLEDAISRIDRGELKKAYELSEVQRKEILNRFPLATWKTLSVDQYALGTPNYKDSFCWLLEYGTCEVGSIKGGSASKHGIYLQRSGEWNFNRRLFGNEQTCFAQIKSDHSAQPKFAQL